MVTINPVDGTTYEIPKYTKNVTKNIPLQRVTEFINPNSSKIEFVQTDYYNPTKNQEYHSAKNANGETISYRAKNNLWDIEIHNRSNVNSGTNYSKFPGRPDYSEYLLETADKKTSHRVTKNRYELSGEKSILTDTEKLTAKDGSKFQSVVKRIFTTDKTLLEGAKPADIFISAEYCSPEKKLLKIDSNTNPSMLKKLLAEDMALPRRVKVLIKNILKNISI